MERSDGSEDQRLGNLIICSHSVLLPFFPHFSPLFFFPCFICVVFLSFFKLVFLLTLSLCLSLQGCVFCSSSLTSPSLCLSVLFYVWYCLSVISQACVFYFQIGASLLYSNFCYFNFIFIYCLSVIPRACFLLSD